MQAPFIWQVADSGYSLSELSGETELLCSVDTTWTHYYPLQNYTGLYRSFAGLTGKDQILHFANKYGFLNSPHDLRFIGDMSEEDHILSLANRHDFHRKSFDHLSKREGQNVLFFGVESISDWTAEIQRLRDVVMLWDAIPERDHAYLKKVIKWKRNPNRVFYRSINSEQTSMIRIHTDDRPIKFGNLTWPAYYYIQDRINYFLNQQVAPQMLWNESNELTLYHVPKNLLGAMWLQFADTVTYNLEYRACRWCGTYFEITRSTRSDRQYCSNSCRVSASRKRTRSKKKK